MEVRADIHSLAGRLWMEGGILSHSEWVHHTQPAPHIALVLANHVSYIELKKKVTFRTWIGDRPAKTM